MFLLAEIRREELLELGGLPHGLGLVAGVLLVAGMLYAVMWLYRRESRVGVGAGLRAGLATLRCCVILTLTGIWLEPVIATYTRQTIPSAVAVLVDVSASMAVRDESPADSAAPPSAARIEQVTDLLTADQHAWLRQLAQQHRVLLYSFGETSAQLPLPMLAASQPDPAAQSRPRDLAASLRQPQQSTNLGQALSTVLQDAGEVALAGVVIFSDGAVNAGPAPLALAAHARALEAPLYLVGVGSLEEPPNLRVAALTAPPVVALGDPMEISVTLAARGAGPLQASLEISAQRVDEQGATQSLRIAERSVDIDRDGTVGPLRFPLTADRAGEWVYRATLSPLPGESITLDNTTEVGVLVSDERLRVLMVAGRPTFDYRAITRLFERDRTIDLSCWLQSADEEALRDGDTVVAALPREPQELFAYDLVLLIDPDPREFDSAWAVTVRRLVDEHGGGLIFQAGPHFTTRLMGDPRLDELVRLLPISPDPEADVRLSSRGTFRTRALPMTASQEASEHPLMRTGPDAQQSAAIWNALPGVWWHLPVLREKQLATVLLSSAGGDAGTAAPLLVTQPVGAGRTLFLATDATWTWRRTSEAVFNRFWVQAARFAAQARRQDRSRRGSLVLDRANAQVGDVVRLEARLLDEAFMPLPDRTAAAQVRLPDGAVQDLTLEAIPAREGWFSGRVAIEQPGLMAFRVPLPGAADDAEALTRNLLVQSPDREMRSLRQHAEVLQGLALATDGRYLTLAAAASLPSEIPDATIEQPPVPGPRRALWDQSWVLGLLVTLLAVEWWLRRRNHLL